MLTLPDARRARRIPARFRLVTIALGLVAAMAAFGPTAGAVTAKPAAPDERVRVVMTELEPFVEDRDGRPAGFYVEIWQVVAAELEVDVDVVWVDRFGDLLTTLDAGEADVAVAPLTPTAERIGDYDFTSSVVASGPQLGFHDRLATSR
ncbi:MAG: transporter substrate-binding domain-containing protein, partial [Actinomycetota bacterium]